MATDAVIEGVCVNTHRLLYYVEKGVVLNIAGVSIDVNEKPKEIVKQGDEDGN